MDDLVGLARYPILLGIFIFLALWLLTWFSAKRFAELRHWLNEEHPVYDAVQGATLTLLALLIGFTFSMALNRYDQRKDLEEEEANAIGTEYLRVDFLSAADAAKARELLVLYIDQRVLFYTTRGEDELAQADQRTAELQRDLWNLVRNAASAQPNP